MSRVFYLKFLNLPARAELHRVKAVKPTEKGEKERRIEK
jgi:hypothetical protein